MPNQRLKWYYNVIYCKFKEIKTWILWTKFCNFSGFNYIYSVFSLFIIYFLFSSSAFAENSLTIYQIDPAITDKKVLPDSDMSSYKAQNYLKLEACPGEFEPVSFVLRADKEIKNLSVIPSSLEAPNGQFIDKEAIDIRLVKCWYKSDVKSIRNSGKRILAPELLLKDNSLVKVDYIQKKNYLKITRKGNEEYFDISSPELPFPKDAEFDDAAELQPFDLPADTNQQIWVTVRVPRGIEAGYYKGRLLLTDNEKTFGEIHIRLQVLPFELSKPILEYAIYYRGLLASKYSNEVGSEHKNPSQYERELRDMKAHGIAYPTLYQRFDNIHLIKAIKWRQHIGFPNDHLYTLGTTTANKTDRKGLSELADKIGTWLKIAQKFGFADVYIYGIDEARSERLLAQMPSWEVAHQLGAKIFVALYEGAVDIAGDDIDVAVLSGYKPDEVKKWHLRGKKVLCYGNPQVGIPDPSIYRSNYGLLLWIGGYDGCMPYAYQHAFGDIWNDFDHIKFRDHVFAYPTTDGLVGTLQWEGFREGVDDIRYLSSLLALGVDSSKLKSALQNEIDGSANNLGRARTFLITRILDHLKSK